MIDREEIKSECKFVQPYVFIKASTTDNRLKLTYENERIHKKDKNK